MDERADAPEPTGPVPERRSGVLLPTWVVVIAVLVIAAVAFGGIGFAIGRATADPSPGGWHREMMERFRNPGGMGLPAVGGGYLGVATEGDPDGARVAVVAPDSPAEEAGLEPGDVITDVDDEEIASPRDLVVAIRSRPPGEEVTIAFTRAGDEREAEVTLGDRAEAPPIGPPTTTRTPD